jgi:hypothetical protein
MDLIFFKACLNLHLKIVKELYAFYSLFIFFKHGRYLPLKFFMRFLFFTNIPELFLRRLV